MEINVKLNVDEINALLGMLGQLPNSSGTYPLLLKIKEQGDSQLKAAQEPAEAPAQ